MTTRGVIRTWDDEDGWGVIDSPDTPGGCWVSYSHIEAGVAPTLHTGQVVSFSFEAVEWQDGYRWRAILVQPEGAEPAPERKSRHEPSSAYRSSLHLTFDDPGGKAGSGST